MSLTLVIPVCVLKVILQIGNGRKLVYSIRNKSACEASRISVVFFAFLCCGNCSKSFNILFIILKKKNPCLIVPASESSVSLPEFIAFSLYYEWFSFLCIS